MSQERSSTPLSDLLSRCEDEDSDQALGELHAHLPSALLGVIVERDGDLVTLGCHVEVDGSRTLVAAADPEAFAERHGGPFNATLPGSALLQAAWSDPRCSGIRINSATRATHLLLGRPAIESLVDADS